MIHKRKYLKKVAYFYIYIVNQYVMEYIEYQIAK
jgi:hypothetical protein